MERSPDPGGAGRRAHLPGRGFSGGSEVGGFGDAELVFALFGLILENRWAVFFFFFSLVSWYDCRSARRWVSRCR